MKKTGEFDNILDACLERVFVKGETVEQCLAGYPEYATELEPLLRTALEAKGAVAVKPRPEFRQRASYQFQAVLREMEAKKSRGFFGWQPRWATALIVVVVLLLAGSGTVAAANSSLPDEPLYPVKLATEDVRLILTPSVLGKEELYASLADRRVAEIIKMAEKGKAEQVERAVQRLDSNLIAMASLTASGQGEAADQGVSTFGAAPEVTEAPVPALAPAPAPAPQQAPELRQQAGETPPPVIAVPPPKAPGLSQETQPGKASGGGGVDMKPDQQAKLKTTLSQRAVENRKALQEVLERAPESVKPALRRAIEVAGAGYERALNNLD